MAYLSGFPRTHRRSRPDTENGKAVVVRQPTNLVRAVVPDG